MVFGAAAVSGISAYASGSSIPESLGAAALGALGGGANAMAKITTGVIKAKFTLQSYAMGVAAGTITSSGSGNDDVADHEKVLEK
jgi:hypothetical protein